MPQNFYSIQPTGEDVVYSLSCRGGGYPASEILATEEEALERQELDEVQNS